MAPARGRRHRYRRRPSRPRQRLLLCPTRQRPPKPSPTSCSCSPTISTARSIDFMPKLKTVLAERGTTFSNHLVNVSVCCPSRVAMLRGQYAHTTGIFGNLPPAGGFEGVVAKKLGGLDDSDVAPRRRLPHGPHGQVPQRVPAEGESDLHTGGLGRVTRLPEVSPTPSSLQPQRERHTGSLRRSTRGLPRRRDRSEGRRLHPSGVGGPKPFFLDLPTYAPHGPATPAPRHQDLFPEARLLGIRHSTRRT